ncbi:MAG: hypothetical protein ABW063_14480 [Caulobacter sp.]
MRLSTIGTAHRTSSHQGVSSCALLGFVLLLAIAFWAGAALIGKSLIALAAF